MFWDEAETADIFLAAGSLRRKREAENNNMRTFWNLFSENPLGESGIKPSEHTAEKGHVYPRGYRKARLQYDTA
jgi:hypothetical protein